MENQTWQQHQQQQQQQQQLTMEVAIFVSLCIVFITIMAFYTKMSRVALNPKKCMIIITGCDSGFGLDTCLSLTSQGYVVVATCMTNEGVARLDSVITGAVVQCDVTKKEDIEHLSHVVYKYVHQYPDCRLWALVNNAGVGPGGFVDWLSMDTFRFVI